jgi:hypothetical protein
VTRCRLTREQIGSSNNGLDAVYRILKLVSSEEGKVLESSTQLVCTTCTIYYYCGADIVPKYCRLRGGGELF